MSYSRAFRQTAFWLVANVVFGLAQYWVLVTGDYMGFEKFGARETIAEGVVTFFCASLMASTCIDYVMSKPQIDEYARYFIYILPVAVFCIVVFMYSQLHYDLKAAFNFHNLAIAQKTIIGIAFVYCIWIKVITIRA